MQNGNRTRDRTRWVEAECASTGEVVVIVPDFGEDAGSMASDRAWALSLVRGHSDPAILHAACRAWVSTTHLGCAYPAGSPADLLLRSFRQEIVRDRQ